MLPKYVYLTHIYVQYGPHKFSLQATIDHHGLSMHFGYNANPVRCCGKHSIQTKAELLSNDQYSKLLNSLCNHLQTDYTMSVWL